MSTELKREIERVRAINRSLLNEDTTQTAVVLPLLSALGWRISDPEEVYLERHTGSGLVDIALFIQGKAAVFIETKPARNKHLENDDKKQLLDYCEEVGVQMGVLTNGYSWYLYANAASTRTDHAVPINLAEGESQKIADDLVCYLSKDRVDGNASEALEAKKIEEVLVKKWDGLLQDGNRNLVSALRSEMKNAGIRLSFPRVKNFVQQCSSAPTNDGTGRKEKASARMLLETKERNLAKTSRKTVKKPTSVKMFERTVEFNGWADMLRTFLDEVYRRDPKCLSILVEHIPSKIVAGKANINRSWRAYQIAETDVWVNTNLNSGDIENLCRDALKVLALPDDHFKLIYA